MISEQLKTIWKCGIDFCCGGNKTLKTACSEINASQSDIENKIAESENAASNAWHKLQRLGCWFFMRLHCKHTSQTGTQLAGTIKKLHGKLQMYTDKSPRVDSVAQGYICRRTIDSAFPRRCAFPAIRETVRTKTHRYKPIILGAINQMHVEHETAGGIFDKINKLSNGL